MYVPYCILYMYYCVAWVCAARLAFSQFVCVVVVVVVVCVCVCVYV